jgi:hypothetical protein
MARYDGEGNTLKGNNEETSVIKIMLGVAMGIALAGLIGFGGRLVLFSAIMNEFSRMIKPINQQAIQRSSISSPTIESTVKEVPKFVLPKTRDELIREQSENAYTQARKETEDFREPYQKPKECYGIKDNKTRMFCANHFIKARKAFENSTL